MASSTCASKAIDRALARPAAEKSTAVTSLPAASHTALRPSPYAEVYGHAGVRHSALRHEQVRRRTHTTRNPDTGRPTLVHPRLHSISRSTTLRIMTDRAGTPAQPDDLVGRGTSDHRVLHRTPRTRRPRTAGQFRHIRHRGSSFKTSFNDDHIAATTQAICEYRRRRASTGPC